MEQEVQQNSLCMTSTSCSNTNTIKDKDSHIVQGSKPVGQNSHEGPDRSEAGTPQDSICNHSLQQESEEGQEQNCPRKKSPTGNIFKIEAVRNQLGEYVCPVCSEVTKSSHAFTQHIRQHNPNDHSHMCRLCGKTLSSASSLDRHMLVHSGERPFKCKYCNMAFTTNGNMHRHMRTHTTLEEGESPSKDSKQNSLEVDTPPLSPTTLNENVNEEKDAHFLEDMSCPVCGKSFLCKTGLKAHMSTHPNDPIQCKKCSEILSNYCMYILHQCQNSVKETTDCDATKPCEIVVPSGQSGFHDLTFIDFSIDKFSLIAKSYCENKSRRPSSTFHIFECDICKKAFPCGSALKLHTLTHGNQKGTFCPSCNCDFPNSTYLQVHQLKHRKAEQCAKDSVHENVECNKEDFLALFELQTKESCQAVKEASVKPVAREEHFECFSYFTSGKLKISSCNSTEKEGSTNHDFADIQSIISVTSKAPLAAASPTQSGSSPRPDSPKVGDPALATPETIPKLPKACEEEGDEDDSVSSSEASPFSCKLCKMTFKNLSILKKHSQLHSHGITPYSCNICSYTSMDKSTLIRHLRTHNGERPFQCSICKYAFTTKANCERHVRKRHKKFTKAEIRSSMQYNPHMSEPAKAAEMVPSEVNNSETVCKYCNVDFKFNRVLRHHLRSLHNSCSQKPFCCSICKLGFSTKNNCIRHALKQHPEMKDKLSEVVSAKPIFSGDSAGEQTSTGMEESPQKETTFERDCNTTPSLVWNSGDSCLDLSGCKEKVGEPLNLTTKSPTEKHCEHFDRGNFNDDDVTIAQSLVALSELPPPQEEPLDLAAHPVDLTVKSTKVTKDEEDVSEARPSSIYSITNYIQQSTSKVYHPPKTPPLGRPPVNGINLSCSTNATAQESSSSHSHDEVYKMTFKMVNEKLAPKNQRSFSCIYCSAGFTLKSNMERHIKRKHPEFARPTRSRNFIPSLNNPGGTPKHYVSTLSDETRTALRVVLNSKANKGTDSMELETSEDKSKEEQREDLKLVSESCSRVTENSSDMEDNAADLASVSSVINTANSQAFHQYLQEEKAATEEEQNQDSSKMDVSENESTMNDSKEKKRSSYTDSPNSVSCPFCSRRFPWTSSLRRHILTHTGQKPFKCPRCPIWFTTKSNCERHLVRKHGRNGELLTRCVPERPFKCNICPSSTFSTQGNLRKHYYLKHWTRSSMDKNAKLNSVLESMQQQNEDSLDAMDDAGEGSSDNSNVPPGKYKSGLHCQCCDETFASVELLEAHIGQHIDLPYKCHLCENSYTNRQECLDHLKTQHDSEYKLLITKGALDHTSCGQDIETSPPLNNNNQTEDDDSQSKSKFLDYAQRKVVCALCLRRFWSTEDLRRHVRTHSGERPFACEICDRKFSLKHSMIRHKRKHLTSSSGVQDSTDEEDNIPPNTPCILRKMPLNKNSLLYLTNQEGPSLANSSGWTGPGETGATSSVDTKRIESLTEYDNMDLIQNLLGITDSKIIDQMLDSADSAAKLLGVKQL